MADFRREYGITAGGIGSLSTVEFHQLLDNLSPEAVWRHRVREHARDVTPAEADAITASLRR